MTTTESCPREDLLAGLLAGALSPEEEAALEAHLAGCAVCRETLEADRAAGAALRALPLPEPSAEARTRAYQAILAATVGQAAAPAAAPPRKAVAPITKMPAPKTAAPRTWQVTRVLGWAAAACLVVVVGVGTLKQNNQLASPAPSSDMASATRAPEGPRANTSVIDLPKRSAEVLAVRPPAPPPPPTPDRFAGVPPVDRGSVGGFANEEPKALDTKFRDAETRAGREDTRGGADLVALGSREKEEQRLELLSKAREIVLIESVRRARREPLDRGGEPAKEQEEQDSPRNALKKTDSPAKAEEAAKSKGGAQDKAAPEELSREKAAKTPAPAPPADPRPAAPAPESAKPGAAGGAPAPGARSVRKGDDRADADAKDEIEATEGVRQAPSLTGHRFKQDSRVILVERDGTRGYYVEDRAASTFAGKKDSGAAAITSWAEIALDDAPTRTALRAVLDGELRAQPHDLRWAERALALARLLGIEAPDRAALERSAAKKAAPPVPAPMAKPEMAK